MTDIYTRRGDDGTTSTGEGSRTRKDDVLIEIVGDIDEANCAIGLTRPLVSDSALSDMLEFIQHRLFNCGARLSSSGKAKVELISQEDVQVLERAIDRLSGIVGGFEKFVLPGCDEASARLHLARAVMRRAERGVVRYAATAPVDPELLAFLNRAGDLLYAAARYAGAGNECAWKPDAEPPVTNGHS